MRSNATSPFDHIVYPDEVGILPQTCEVSPHIATGNRRRTMNGVRDKIHIHVFCLLSNRRLDKGTGSDAFREARMWYPTRQQRNNR